MKILRLDLRAFGPFTGVSLDLSGGSEGFHLVYGPNEAGKTSALRAMGQLFYGIPANSPDDFVHAYPKLRIGALLARRDGTRLELVRRKGSKGTLLGPDDGTPVDEAQLRGLLGGCDQGQFDTMFGINHPALIAGGQDIIRGHGEVGHVLFAAGAGIADLRAIRSRLEDQAADLFKPQAKNPAINKSLAALKEARQRIRQSQLPSTEWIQREKALREATEQLQQTQVELQRLSGQKNRLERIGQALPVLRRRREIEESLAKLGDVPLLSDDFADARRDALARLETARKIQQELAEEIQTLEGQIQALVVPESLLAQAEAIDETYRALSVYRKAQGDLPALSANRQRQEKEAAEILRQLRPGLTLEAAGSLQLPRHKQVEIQNLGNRKESLRRQLDQARSEMAESQRRLSQAEQQLASLPPPADPAPLADAIRQARSQGDLDRQAADARAELDALDQQVEVDRGSLGLWTSTLDALEQLAVPSAETIDRFDQDLSEADAGVRRLQEDLDKARAAAADLERQTDALRLEGDVPTEDDLAEARRLRDLGWRLVLNEWRHGVADPEQLRAFLGHFDRTSDLAQAYEQAVHRADELADRLRREAARVATRAALQAGRLAAGRQIAEIGNLLEAARQQVRQTEDAWLNAWRPLAIEPLSPREMRAWLQRQQAMVQEARATRGRRAALAQLEARVAAHGRQLRRSLADLGRPAGDDERPLAAILARAEAACAEVEAVEQSRRQLGRDVAELNQAVDAARAKVDRSEAELADWQARWTAAIEPLGLPADAAPEVVNEVVAQTGELLGRLREVAAYAERIEAIGADAQRFRQDVKRLVESVDPDRRGPPASPEQAVEELSARLRRAAADQKNLDLLTRQRQQLLQKRDQAGDEDKAAAARLSVLCREARCLRVEDLQAAERASSEAARLRADLSDCSRRLLDLSAGQTVEALDAEAKTVHADELPAQLRQLDDQIADADRRHGGLRETIGGQKAFLASMDPSADAADAAEDVQELLARIEPDALHYLRLRLASAVLREGIDRYRKRNEGPVLSRASEHFARLTLGSFEGLRIDFDDKGEQVLAGVRPGGQTVLPAAMSEGTCDQLYLALRLASLETWLDRNEPMPFIVDDILISFDNARATAALEVLAALSRRTQVIFFTHHVHLVELARGCMGEDVLFVHQLAPCP